LPFPRDTLFPAATLSYRPLNITERRNGAPLIISRRSRVGWLFTWPAARLDRRLQAQTLHQ